ncbi:hypothetical protein S83_062535 [Arachis hypogaea]
MSRTKHTTQVVAATLNLPFEEGPQCKVVEDLDERYFGPSFELLSYDKVSEMFNGTFICSADHPVPP